MRNMDLAIPEGQAMETEALYVKYLQAFGPDMDRHPPGCIVLAVLDFAATIVAFAKLRRYDEQSAIRNYQKYFEKMVEVRRVEQENAHNVGAEH